MNTLTKRIIAAVLLLFGSLILVILLEDYYVKILLAAILATAATLILRREKRLEEMARIRKRAEEELDAEEAMAGRVYEAGEAAVEVEDNEKDQEKTEPDNPYS